MYYQIYDGSNTNGLRLHPASGFTSNTRPKITLTAESGEMLVRFTSDALHSSTGWEAEFSAGNITFYDIIIHYIIIVYKFNYNLY